MSQRALGASSPLLRGTDVSGDSESVAAGVSIPLLCASEAVTLAQGFLTAPCREVPAPWHAAEQRQRGCSSGTRGLTMPCAGWDVPGQSPGPAGGLG